MTKWVTERINFLGCSVGAFIVKEYAPYLRTFRPTIFKRRVVWEEHTMPEDDIYKSKQKYENFIKLVESGEFLLPPEKRKNVRGKAKYYCKHKINLQYFLRLFNSFEAQDLSYIRRRRILCNFRLICYVADKDLANLDRDDIDKIVAYMHKTHKSPKSKADFVKVIKRTWRILFPEKDEKGRIDESLCPYSVRHLKANGDKSREKAREDKLTWEEFESIVKYFSDNLRMQSFLTLAVESLGRPQEILYTKIKDLEICGGYAKLNISEHGKEGIGILQCIDSFPYMMKWLNQHPLKDDKNAFIFINEKKTQLTPKVVGQYLKKACLSLGINKPVTPYSLKRNGVTFARLRGESDMEIQHKARWSSTRQLKTYDMSNQEDSFKMQLAKRGLIKHTEYNGTLPQTKTCSYCGFDKVGFTEDQCSKCLRILEGSKLKEEIVKNESLNNPVMQKLMETLNRLQTDVEQMKNKEM